MIYCEMCGAANDTMSEQCHRCGHQLVAGDEPLVPAAGSASDGETVGASIGAGLEIPDWLKRAAAETPPAPPAPAPAAPDLPPPGYHVAGTSSTPTTDDLFQPEPERSGPPTRPLPPVPTPGLPNAMPDWLKSSSATPGSSPEPDAADTTTFISENDLPEWIRQIAAADAAKKVEEERRAAEAAGVAEATDTKRVVLPGGAAQSAPAANPWLSRRDGSPRAKYWGATDQLTTKDEPVAASAAAERAETAEPVAKAEPAEVQAAKKGLGRKAPSVAMPGLPKLTVPSLKHDAAVSDGSPRTLRVILLAALVVMLLVLVAATLL